MQVRLQLMIIYIGFSDHFNIFVFTLSKNVNIAPHGCKQLQTFNVRS